MWYNSKYGTNKNGNGREIILKTFLSSDDALYIKILLDTSATAE